MSMWKTMAAATLVTVAYIGSIAMAAKPALSPDEAATSRSLETIQTAEPRAKKLRADETKEGERLHREGRKLMAKGKLKEAEAVFTASAKAGYPKSYRMLGNLALRAGNKAKAIAAYRKYLKHRPKADDAKTIATTIKRLGG